MPSEQWTKERLRLRDAQAWFLRVNDATVEEIATMLQRADRKGGTGLTKARAWQFLHREFERRAAAAETPEEVEALYAQIRLKSMGRYRDEALARLRREAA